MPKIAQSNKKIPLKVKQCEPIPFRHTKAHCFSEKMIEEVMKCYTRVMNKNETKKTSQKQAYRQTRQLWLQKFPSKTISIPTIARICSSQLKEKTNSTTNSASDDAYNVLNNTERLKAMRQASSDLASQPIYKYIC